MYIVGDLLLEIIGAKSYAKDDITIIRDLNQLDQLPKEKENWCCSSNDYTS